MLSMSIASELTARGKPRRHRAGLEIFLVAGPPVGGPHDEPGAPPPPLPPKPPAASWSVLKLMVELDGVSAVGAKLAVGEQAVRHFQHHLFGLGRAIEEDQGECGLEDEVAARLGPAPDAVFGHLAAAEVGGADLTVAGGVDAGEPFEALGGLHRALDLLWGCRSRAASSGRGR